jgi:protease I
MDKNLGGLRVAILATDGFEESELVSPMKVLTDAGVETLVVAPKIGDIQGMQHDVRTKTVAVDLPLWEADPDEFDGVILPGGAMNADALRMDERARDFVRAMDGEQKPIAVICHGSWLLVSAGLVKGRTLTSAPAIRDDIVNAGGTWEDREAVRDGNWVSSRRPSDLPFFNRALLSLFIEQKTGTTLII